MDLLIEVKTQPESDAPSSVNEPDMDTKEDD